MINLENKIQHVNAWKKSGKSRALYCRENKISYTTFLKWVLKFEATPDSFKEVKIVEEKEINYFEFNLNKSFEFEIRFRFTF